MAEVLRNRGGRRYGRVATYDEAGHPTPTGYAWALTRIALGWIFLWAFLDKLLGFGFTTPPERAWINGGNPTLGFLGNVEGPFADVFRAMAGNAIVNWLFMIGLLAIGVALILGIGVRIAAAAGATMLLLMYLASLPLETNPIIDDHIIYALVLIGLALADAGRVLGLGRWWSGTQVVQRNRWLA